jgi:phage terminase small subunit
MPKQISGAQKRLEGDRSKNKKHKTGSYSGINPAEPIICVKLKPCPAHIKGPAAELYKLIDDQLSKPGITTIADQVAVEAACLLYAQMRRWVNISEADPEDQKAAQEVRSTSTALLAYLRIMGMTPVDRQKIAAFGVDAPQNPFEKYGE